MLTGGRDGVDSPKDGGDRVRRTAADAGPRRDRQRPAAAKAASRDQELLVRFRPQVPVVKAQMEAIVPRQPGKVFIREVVDD